MRFKYKAQKKDGTPYEGIREATDRNDLYRDVQKEGEELISAFEFLPQSRFGLGSLDTLLGRIKIHEKVIFARNIGGMLTAGLSLSRSLSVLERQTSNRKFKGIISELNTDVGKGAAFSEALGRFPRVFSALFIAMVRAGEEGGNLAASFKRLSEQLDRAYILQRKLKGALVYPAIVVCIMILIGIIMLIYVVPQLTDTFKDFGVDLPISTQIVVGASDFLRNNFWYALLILCASVVAFFFMLRNKHTRRLFDRGVLKLPVFSSLVQQANAARTARTLSSLLSAGVAVIPALEIATDVVSNSLYKEVLIRAREMIQKGDPISGVFREREDLYPPFLGEMVAVGEETGRLSGVLEEAGVFFEDEVDQKTKDLSTIIEPLLMVAVGAAVGFFAVAMISPAYSLMNSI